MHIHVLRAHFLFEKIQAGDELFLPRPATVNGWTPLHMVLVAGGNSTIVRSEAPDLIKVLLEKFPESASMRIQPELGLVEGHLPLYLAIQYAWDVDTVKAIIAAYPDATMTVDVIMKNKGKNPNVKKDLFVSYSVYLSSLVNVLISFNCIIVSSDMVRHVKLRRSVRLHQSSWRFCRNR